MYVYICVYVCVCVCHYLLSSWYSQWQPQSKWLVENHKVLVLCAPCSVHQGHGCLKECIWPMWQQTRPWLGRKPWKHKALELQSRLWPTCLGLGLRAQLACGSLSALLTDTLGCHEAGFLRLLLLGSFCPCCWTPHVYQRHILPHLKLQVDRFKTCYEIFLHYLQHRAYSLCSFLNTAGGFPSPMVKQRA